ncbi:Hypothetical predicted protein [Cloeon dipterum]|uniref:Receptor ligand binding region domain-containing protein n=1 Tax=Cloeon dipterum TaxID=197152 RepID=A0A8S1E3G8_9INSE|nr:Hypothetical predicted protein [Cloeon dipterum]
MVRMLTPLILLLLAVHPGSPQHSPGTTHPPTTETVSLSSASSPSPGTSTTTAPSPSSTLAGSTPLVLSSSPSPLRPADATPTASLVTLTPTTPTLLLLSSSPAPNSTLLRSERPKSPTVASAVVADEVEGAVWPVKREAVVEGDLVLGGLMMVHEREDSITCGPIMPQGGVQALEAMLYTVDRVNEDRDFLPGFTLGAYVLDDCDKDTYGLEMAVDFIKGEYKMVSVAPLCGRGCLTPF